MTRNPRLLVPALVVVAVLALVFWPSEGPDRSPIAPVRTRIESASSRLDPAIDALSERRALPSGVDGVEAPAASEEEAAKAPEEEPGFVHGRLYDAHVEPIPRGRVLFKPVEPLSCPGVGCFADKYGDYRTKLRPGNWRVFYTGRPTDTDRGWISMGELQIYPRLDQAYDLQLLGDRVLAGGFWLGDMDSILLEVELRLAYDDSFLVGQAYCTTSKDDYQEYLDALEEENPDVPRKRTPRPPGRGGFLFRGLAPDLYELRAYFDVAKTCYVTMPVDLTDGDVEFQPLELVKGDFFQHRVLTP